MSNKREITPGTRNLPNYLCLVRSWVLEETLIPPPVQEQTNKVKFMPKDECSSHSSPEMILFTADGGLHCKSQLNTTQRSIDLCKHRTKKYSTTPALKTEGTWFKRKQKNCKNHRTKKSAVRLCLLEMAA